MISARYAFHVATGVGHRFNASGPPTDGVTPLGWAFVLAPFARGGALHALAAAKIIGLVAWVASAGLLAVAIRGVSDRPVRWAALVLLPISAPLAVWSVAGMETGVVAALAAIAVSSKQMGRWWPCSICAGVAAAWRPELVPWAVFVAAAPLPNAAPQAGTVDLAEWRRRTWYVAVALFPFAVTALVRAVVFGRLAPLSIYAKPPALELGARYALACFLLTGPVAIVAPLAWASLASWPRWLVAATFAHFAAIALAGGDWMPLSRLAVPALPGVVLAAAHVASVADRRWTTARLALAFAGEAFAMIRVGPSAAGVGPDRSALIEELRPVLDGSKVIATVDAGWVGAAAPRATIVDLAGVTDPAIASAPGHHIAKAWPPKLIDERNVDTAVLWIAEGAEVDERRWFETPFARGADQRLMLATSLDFEPVAVSRGRLRYLVVRRKQREPLAQSR